MTLRIKHLSLAALVFLLFAITSCKKLPQHVGDNLQPSNNFIRVAFTGNQDIVSEVERIDSLSTNFSSLSLLGNMNDPHFGNSNLSFYSQIGMTSNSIEWGDGAVADSVVLQMVYSGYYGDTLDQMSLHIYEVLEDMDPDSTTYYSNTSLEYGNELAYCNFEPRPKTPSNIEDDSLSVAVLRINMDPSFGQRLIDNEAAVSSSSAFQEHFKGIYLSCDETSETGSICYFNLLNTKSYMRVYYHNNSDTSFCDFNFSDKYARFNHFEHDYNSAAAPISFDDTASNQYLYVQSTAGVRTRLQFPNLAQWAQDLNTNVLINEAKIIMSGANGIINGQPNDTAMFTQPIQLIAVKAKADGSYGLLSDQLVGTSYFGGFYDPETDQIWFRISEYIQDLVLNGPEAEDYGIYIYTYSGSFNAKRWIFCGPDNPDTAKALKLEIYYSQIDD